ncbi:DUF1080 domain-containing protein [Solirubrobacter sp. CPCC 204708]|uniref:DUF1080 domain-containing protein n=1 Tax=Solirubrobacter deserti TaxID=2282478 RepID=A0ABT4RNA8_9ACTN|nr:family 16 glycoside hydrolase [Solirubrobacter deserti]MBE2317473.1 DUF1080 domain-containing protein [Solirubrobacter deserti]MDA0140055.1 DUF1080 domain-containing protein [Solirubrobacter deserti]
MQSGWERRSGVSTITKWLALLCGLVALLGASAPLAHAQQTEQGVTQRIFQLGAAPSELCPIKPAQTPNFDELKPTIDWEGDAAFGGFTDNFVVHAIATLTVPTAGSYTFRLRSDDGSELFIGETKVVDNDGLHGAEDQDGTIQLTAGTHALRINFFEAGGGQELRLSWRKPGDSGFTIVPNSALTTDRSVRVTSPGTKQCEGQNDTPGDGLPLDSVNPAYDLVNFRPADFEPKVTGLEWMGDDLLVLTWGDDDGDPTSITEAGEIWKLSGVKTAANPSTVTRTKIAEGLREPQGLKIVDGAIYVSEKHQLTKLADADSNGTFETETKVASYPFDGNFHEFGFGLLYKDGFFYVNLSVSINLGGATTIPQGSQDRGTHIKISKDTGAIEYVAGGLRTPHGIGWGPDNEIFVTDNQGAWLPANKLLHIKPGAFYNHFTTEADGTPGRFDNQKPTPPALWLPQNEIANSPSQPLLIPDGPFAGQMYIADVTYGGIQRAFLEKVEGEYQGAYFRHTQGLEAGLTRMLLQEDGSIIVGGLHGGGNWGQNGKKTFGLQKLRPNGTQTFDMQKMELVDGDFKITYTKPLSDATAANLASKYTVKSWGYAPTAQYGGPKIGEKNLTVTGATLSADKKVVTLDIAGLEPNKVVYVRSPRPFAAADGTEILSTEAWYTLNKLPGYVAPVSEGFFELEEGVMAGGAKFDTEHAGFTGNGFVSGIQTKGSSSVKIEMNAGKAGDYRMALHYANGPNPFAGPKKMTLIVNGTSRQITLPSTGTWKTWGYYLDTVALKAGVNEVELLYGADDDGNVNLDNVRFAPAGTTRHEAEAGTLAGGANAQTEHAGYSGLGYVGGYQNLGASTTFKVSALADGEADVKIGYANGPHPAPGTKRLSLYVNGVFVKKVAFPSTGQWNQYGSLTDKWVLKAGSNDVMLKYDQGDEANVNLDYLDVTQNEPISCEPQAANDTFDGTTLNRCRWTTILNPDPAGYSVADGKLQIKAQAGDITGGTVSAKNIILQPGPTDGSWAATTKISIDGNKEYTQGGIVAYAGTNAWAKVVVMRRPNGTWTTELGRQSGYANSDIPANAQKAITLQMYARDGQLRGRWSINDGQTWTEIGDGFTTSGLGSPSIGLSAYNGTGSETATFEHFTVGEPPEAPPVPPCETLYTPEAGYEMLLDGSDAMLTDKWQYSGSGRFVREGCTFKSVGGFGLMYTKKDYDAPYSLKLDWMMPGDDNSGIFVGFPDTGANTVDTSIQQGEEIQIDPTDNPAQTTGAIYLEQAADAAARDAVLKPAGQWNSYEIQVKEDRIIVILNGVKINEWVDDDAVSDLKQGRIGLQMHGNGDDVFFRNVRVGKLGTSVSEDVTIGSDVAPTLSLQLPAPTTNWTFLPNVEKTYEATTEAKVTSTAGDATLSVSPSPAFLSNGAYTLSEPLQVSMSKTTWTGPVSNDPVAITFKQHIGANQPLRTGNYTKTLTFTLATTNP